MLYPRRIILCAIPFLWSAVYSGTLDKRDFPVSQDYSHSEQNNPAVAVGLDGRFAVVWVDFRFGDGDVYCRLYDSGAVEFGDDFAVNDDRIGAWQLEPALSFDWYGNYYAVWIDYRNSVYPFDPDINWDVYAQSFDAYCLYMHIEAGGLDYGIHQGSIRLIDLQHNDSTAFISVALTVTGPLIDIEPDSVHLTALMETGSPSPQTIIVNNSGSGGIDFDLTATDDWLTLDKTSGSDGEAVLVGCEVTSLVAGEYRGFIIASDSGTLNSPESLSVMLSLQADRSYMATVPQQVDVNLLKGETMDDSLRVVNLSAGALNWRAECDASWLTLQSDSGQENEVIRYSIESSALDAGTYLDSVVITDGMAFNNPLTIAIRVAVSVTDTVVMIPVQVEMGMEGQAPLFLYNHNRFRSGVFRIQYDKSMLTVDSIGGAPGGLPFDSLSTEIDRVSGMFTVNVTVDSGLAVEPGYYHLGDIFITANDSNTGTAYWNDSEDTLHFYLENDAGARMIPVLNGGEITISEPTGVADEQTGTIPSVFFLGQNSPNPFNGGTTITYGLRRSGPVRIEVYNILGQAAAVIVDDYLPAGVHLTRWDGKDARRREMASGIYFYRMSTPGFISVRKMIFLK